MQSKKHWGQHFLEPAWADKVLAVIDPQPGDWFLEIGPGRGALTQRLAPRVARVTAVEIDADMVRALTPAVPANVTVLHQDFLEFDWSGIDADPVRVAGNLPYNVSSPVVFRILETHRASGRIRDATLMLQREVADRLAASPSTSDYGVLAILVQVHAEVRRLLTLPPGAFRPAPKVQSAVVRLSFRPPAVSLRDERLFVAMVRSLFLQRRKTLGNALKRFSAAHGREAISALSAAGLDARRRAETLQLTELARLAEVFAAN